MWKKFNIDSARETFDDMSIHIVRVHGYLDSSTFPELQEHLESLIAGGVHRIIIEFGDLDYISSAGLGVLMGMLQEVRQYNGDLKLANMSSKIRNLFDMLGFSRLVRIYEDVNTAARAFQEERETSIPKDAETPIEDNY